MLKKYCDACEEQINDFNRPAVLQRKSVEFTLGESTIRCSTKTDVFIYRPGHKQDLHICETCIKAALVEANKAENDRS